MTDIERGLRQPALVNDAPAGHRPSGFDPARDLAGVDAVAEYFDADSADVANHMAWHAGYAAGTQQGAGYSAGYADAERHIMDWLLTPEADGCDIVEAISSRRHAIAMETREGQDPQGLGAKHDSAAIAQPKEPSHE